MVSVPQEEGATRSLQAGEMSIDIEASHRQEASPGQEDTHQDQEEGKRARKALTNIKVEEQVAHLPPRDQGQDPLVLIQRRAEAHCLVM